MGTASLSEGGTATLLRGRGSRRGATTATQRQSVAVPPVSDAVRDGDSGTNMLSGHPEFGRVVAAARGAAGPVLVVGGVDCGKTTLVRQIASAMAERGPVWIVAADTGQAWIGPPTTVSRALLARARRRWSRIQPERMIFLGATSPAPCVRQAADALVRLAVEGIPAGERVIVDTPGLVTGRLAESFWRRVASRIGVPLVVAIQCRRELAPILRPIQEAGARIVTVKPDPRVRVRGRGERTAYRAAAWRRYFRRAAMRWLDRAGLLIRPAIPRHSAAAEAGRLVALRDSSGRDLALGIIAAVGPKRIGILTPLGDLAEIAMLIVGSLRVEPATGREEAGDYI